MNNHFSSRNKFYEHGILSTALKPKIDRSLSNTANNRENQREGKEIYHASLGKKNLITDFDVTGEFQGKLDDSLNGGTTPKNKIIHI